MTKGTVNLAQRVKEHLAEAVMPRPVLEGQESLASEEEGKSMYKGREATENMVYSGNSK